MNHAADIAVLSSMTLIIAGAILISLAIAKGKPRPPKS